MKTDKFSRACCWPTKSASRLGLSEDVFRRARSAPVPVRPPAPPAQQPAAPAWPPRELQLIQVMAIDPDVARSIRTRGTLQHFRAEELARAGASIAAAWDEGRSPSLILDGLGQSVADALTPAIMGDGPVAQWEDRLANANAMAELIEAAALKAAREPKLSALRQAERSGAADVRDREADLRDELRRKEGGAG